MKESQEQANDLALNCEIGDTYPQGSFRTRSERLDLIHQVFERCKRLKLRAPLLSDLGAFLDGRTSVMPPVVESSNKI